MSDGNGTRDWLAGKARTWRVIGWLYTSLVLLGCIVTVVELTPEPIDVSTGVGYAIGFLIWALLVIMPYFMVSQLMEAVAVMLPSSSVQPKGEWRPDPTGRFPDRWFDNTGWTKWVRDKPGGTTMEDLHGKAGANSVSPAAPAATEPAATATPQALVASAADPPEARWRPDPTGRYPHRFFDASGWTAWIRDEEGVTKEDPVGKMSAQRMSNPE